MFNVSEANGDKKSQVKGIKGITEYDLRLAELERRVEELEKKISKNS